ncbi:MAG: DUF6713 family protein [Bacteroidota bacterium]
MFLDFHILGLSFILLHELDAIRCKEWRIFPGLSALDDRMGFIVFTFLHVPLFYWVLAALQVNNTAFRAGFDYFLIIHLGLHILFLWHPKNEFKDWVSWSIIVGAALFGGLDLVMR